MKKLLSIILSFAMMTAMLGAVNTTYAAASKPASRNIIISKWHICSLVEVKQPTCTKSGYNKYKCRLCKYTTKKVTAPLGHKAAVDKAVAPTCTKSGLTQGSHCSRCKAVIKAQKVVKATGHNIQTTITKATPNANGKIVKSCTKCGKITYNEVLEKPVGIKLSVDSCEYTGNPITPDVMVYSRYFEEDNTYSIIDSAQYTVNYLNNVNAGTATVKVTFNSDYYEGTMQTSFTIKEKVTQNTSGGSNGTTTVKNNTYRPEIVSVSNVSVLMIQANFKVDTAYSTYVIQVAGNKSFSNIIASKTVKPRADYLLKGSYTDKVPVKTPGMTYYVRVKAGNYYSPVKAIKVTK